jgi:glycosyltransferase involved in cell wall biosynthesis
MPPTFSVITPTFNRRHSITEVYAGLRRQTFRDFEWIIVDDGSTDDTAGLVAGWHAEFPIRYRRQENLGKPSAVNTGLAETKGTYVVILDSDDVPLPHALDTFVQEFQAAPADVCSIASLTMRADGSIVGSELSEPIVDMTMLEAYSRRNTRGDKWLAFRTDVAQSFRFPVYGSEKFVPEGIVFNQMSRRGYRTRFINRPLLMHEYSPDGLTENTVRLKADNPIGFIAYHVDNVVARDATLSPYYVKSAASIYASLILASKRSLVTTLLIIVALPVGLVRGWWDKRKADPVRTPAATGGRFPDAR